MNQGNLKVNELAYGVLKPLHSILSLVNLDFKCNIDFITVEMIYCM